MERGGVRSQFDGLGNGAQGLDDGPSFDLFLTSVNARPYFCCKAGRNDAAAELADVMEVGACVEGLAVFSPMFPVLAPRDLVCVHDASVNGLPRSEDITCEIQLRGKWYSLQECGWLRGKSCEKMVRNGE